MINSPDFRNVSDTDLHSYEDFIQKMLFVYSYDKQLCSHFKQVWKDLVKESADRRAKSAIEVIDKQEKEEAKTKTFIKPLLARKKM